MCHFLGEAVSSHFYESFFKNLSEEGVIRLNFNGSPNSTRYKTPQSSETVPPCLELTEFELSFALSRLLMIGVTTNEREVLT